MKSFIRKSARIQQHAENATLTVTAPGSGKYNCLTGITVESDGAGDVTITSGSKTWKTAIGAGGGIAKDFIEDPWVGSENATIVITAPGTNYTINVEGYVHP